jgi:hypothetical protein
MDRLTGMAVFVAAIEEGSLVSAARRFGLSSSTAGTARNNEKEFVRAENHSAKIRRSPSTLDANTGGQYCRPNDTVCCWRRFREL